ncbi:hemolysin family protein [Corynebacterium sp. YIM 101645]|uniref:Hemolysin family protein n=1 Tax=Corynebacterium lemuris TaxID=1859292 RepID=A0ABT2FY14_9CORY|nr:hemolysin family protein [Corynebacterium lemuris]MCS5480128.1 hemolysin family protein [Corynebacterium lemuris]
MDIDVVWLGTVTVLALALSGLLGTVESAVSSVSRARTEGMVKDDVNGARSLLTVLDRRADHINLLVLLKTLLDATAAVFAAALAREYIASDLWAITLAIVAVTVISYAIVGVFGRTMGRKNPYSISLRSAVVLQGVAYVLGPISRLLIWTGNRIAPGAGFRHGPYATEVELREMVDIAQEHGIVEIEERRMIQSVFDLASTTARQVMVPRTEMIWIEDDKHAGQATSLCVRSGHSRVPVVGENIDDIVGIVYIKDLVRHTYHLTDGGASVSVREVMRPATFVPESKNLDELLHEMQRDQIHMAMLVDEYGGIAGLITLEDILEEIVGEIADEYDISEVAPIERLSDRKYRAVFRLSLEDLTDQIHDDLDLDIDFPEDISEQVESVAGLIGYEIGRVPLPGSVVETCGLRLTAEGGRDRRGRRRVRSVIVEVLEHAGQRENGNGED